MYLEKLANKLNVTDELDKAILAAIVHEIVIDNKLLGTCDEGDFELALINGFCDLHAYNVCVLAAYHCNYLISIFKSHIGYTCDCFVTKEIFPYLAESTAAEGMLKLKINE